MRQPGVSSGGKALEAKHVHEKPLPSRLNFALRRLTLALAVIAIYGVFPPAAWSQSATNASRGTRILGETIVQGMNDEGTVIGGTNIFSGGKSATLLGPLGHGEGTLLVAINNRGQILGVQKVGTLRYFLYDPTTKEFKSIGMTAEVNEGGAVQTVKIAYFTNLDEEGRVYGAYATKHGPCGAVGKPTLGAAGDKGPAPTEAAKFDLVGCPGNGAVILSINRKGQIAGSIGPRAFLWSNGTLTPIAFPGSLSSSGYAVNDSGWVTGSFVAGYAVSETGVITPYEKPGMTLPGAFVYDGSRYRFIKVRGESGMPVLTAINNRGQVAGHVESGGGVTKGFIADIEGFPFAQMAATRSEETAAAVDKKLSTGGGVSSKGNVDEGYKVLQAEVSQRAASAIRAVQALEKAGPLSNDKRVQEWTQVSLVTLPKYISVEEARNRAIGGLLDRVFAELSQKQKTKEGTETVLHVVNALAGEEGLRALKAAGELAPFGGPVQNSPQNKFTAEEREKFKSTIRAAIAARPIEIPMANLRQWVPPQKSDRQVEKLDETLRALQSELGTPAAAIFLAWNEVRDAGIGEVFSWQVVNQFVEMNTVHKQAEAEQLLRQLTGVAAPAVSPGWVALRDSGGVGKDEWFRNGASDSRANLAGVIGNIAERMHKSIDGAGGNSQATGQTPGSASGPNDAVSKGNSTAKHEAEKLKPDVNVNLFPSPKGSFFSGRDGKVNDGALTFTLIDAADARNGQRMTFKNLVPVNGKADGAWIVRDEDGYIVFSVMASGALTGQVLPGKAGEGIYEKAREAQGKVAQ
jgi:hypothetical protein